MARVLVIDDDPTIRQVIGFALEDEGYDVAEAPDGAAALDLIAQRHPDIILADMRMPGMDGWAFVKTYRARYGRRAPIIVLTAAQDPDQRGTEVDADGLLAKPFDLDRLVECVANAAQGTGGQDSG